MRCAIVDPSAYDWEGDRPLNRPIHESIIYEVHVGGFTRSPSVRRAASGHVRGVVEKIPYLKALGVTAVELLPVFEFDDSRRVAEPGRRADSQLLGLQHRRRSSARTPATASSRRRVAASTSSAISSRRCTGPASKSFSTSCSTTPTKATSSARRYSFRGIDNRTFYLLDPDNPADVLNYSGGGNTFNANHPLPQKFIVDCLRYWVEEMHVDGFRFDEGSILARGEDGAPLRASAGDLADRAGRRARRHQGDRRSVGRRRPVSGRAFPRRPMGGMERRAIATTSGGSSRAIRDSPARSRRGWAAARTSTRRADRRRRTASTSSPSTTASR